ncbi:MAG: hypothetical protein HS115_01690 [Spirochaetales bacterium]|nr:hypothetical protein [Spirochaetales bacterium]
MVFLGISGATCKARTNRSKDRVLPAKCEDRPEGGPCRAYLERYFFDSTAGKCKSFIWGGCQGNVPFESKSACLELCEK